MNPYNLQQSFYPVGDTIALAIYLFYWIMHFKDPRKDLCLYNFASIIIIAKRAYGL